MIDISNSVAAEIQLVLSELREYSKEAPGNRASNMRRRATLIINYLTKKQKKDERNSNPPEQQLPRTC